jgi:hypothetical protein
VVYVGRVFLRSFEEPYPVTITAERLFPVPLLLFALLWSLVIFWRNRKSALDHLLIFWLIFFAFAVLRVMLLIFIMLQRVNPSYFWEGWPLALSTMLLAMIVPNPGSNPQIPLKGGLDSAAVSAERPKHGFAIPPFLKGEGGLLVNALGLISAPAPRSPSAI